MRSNYLIKYHEFYYRRNQALKEQVKKLKKELPKTDFLKHEVVKFAARIKKAELEIIPTNPNKPEYKLKRELKKFRRYKQGLQRYRIMFCFSSNPPIILYLYPNDQKHLRKDGSKKDPYEEFLKLVNKGTFSHDPNDPKIQKWIRKI